MNHRIRFSKLIPACAGMLGLTLSAAAAAQTAPPDSIAERAHAAALDTELPVSPRVTTGELDNGFRYYIRENHEPESRAVLRLVVRIGSIVERDDERGLAHFLEHMAFNGTENFERQQIVSFMESIGMRLGPGVNAMTSFDQTVYELTLPTGEADHMETAFRILEDWAHGMSLEPEQIAQERDVVIEEWRRRQGAGARAQRKHNPVLLHGSRYAERLPIGTPETIESFDRETVSRFYREWYRPELLAVVAVGDVDAERIEALVRRHFEGLSAPEDASERRDYAVPAHAETLYSIVSDTEIPTASVSVYHKLPAETDRTVGDYRRRIVEHLYNRMLSLRFREIAREPDAPFHAARSSKGRLVGPAAAYMLGARVPEDGVERGLEALVTEAERVDRYGFTESELERARASVLRELESRYANRENRPSSRLAAEYVRSFVNGEPIPGLAYEHALHRRFVPEITLAEVNSAGREWMRDSSRVVLVTAPDKPGLSLPDQEALARVLDEAGDAELAPYEDDLADAELLAEAPEGTGITRERTRPGNVTEWELANGVRVVLKPTDFEEDEVRFTAFSPGGTSLASEDELVPARTADSVIPAGGVGELDATQLQKLLADELVNVNAYIGNYREGLAGNASPQDLETMFKLIYLRFTAPRADRDAFEAFRQRRRAQLENREHDPDTVFGDTFRRIMTQDHPRRRPMTADMLEETDLERSLEFYEQRFADASDFTFVFVGTFGLETMRPLVERYLGGLPATGRDEAARGLGVGLPRGVVEETVRQGIEPRSRTRIAFPPPESARFDDAAERVLLHGTTLVLENRLSDVLREQLGGTYSVRVRLLSYEQPRRLVPAIEFTSAPARAEELAATVFDEIEALASAGPDEARVADARTAMRRMHETRLEQNGFWVSALAESYRYDADPGAHNVLSYESRVEGVTSAATRAAMERYFDTDDYVRVVLMPEDAER